MLRDVFIFLSENPHARRIAMNAPGARSMARRFVAGETIEEGIAAARDLVARGFFVSLDYLGEAVKNREEAVAAADMYVQLIRRIGGDAQLRERVNVSLKLTQMGQDIRQSQGAGGGLGTGGGAGSGGGAGASRQSPGATKPRSPGATEPRSPGAPELQSQKAPEPEWPRPPRHATPENDGDWDEAFLRSNVVRILDVAREHDIFVRFDMEGTPHTQRTLDFFRKLWDGGYRNVGVVLQSYLRRSAHDVREANLLGARVRLCKGAYNEPEQYAFQRKSDVDESYVELMKMLLSEGNYPGIATHDDAMIRATREYSGRRDLPPSGWEFQMLYGIRRDLQNRLIDEGYNLRVYVPFGEAWYPYLMRRLAERPANVLFLVNALLRESPLGGLFRH